MHRVACHSPYGYTVLSSMHGQTSREGAQRMQDRFQTAESLGKGPWSDLKIRMASEMGTLIITAEIILKSPCNRPFPVHQNGHIPVLMKQEDRNIAVPVTV